MMNLKVKNESDSYYPAKIMHIGLASDHGGYELKMKLFASLKEAGYNVVDFGAIDYNKDDDYPDIVIPLARAVAKGTVARGLAICGRGVGACIITNGAGDIYAFSDGTLFEKTDISRFPVLKKVSGEVKLKGDTTGCGDNFVGGAITSLAWQMGSARRDQLSLQELLSWAVASGGFTCSYLGGTFLEKSPGEKFRYIEDYREEYLKQTRGYK